MKPAFNCFLECDGKPCTPSVISSHQGIICDEHLKCFGLATNFVISEQGQTREIAGGYLFCKANVVFEPGQVLFPKRDFLDSALGFRKDEEREEADPDTERYTLTTPMREFFSRLFQSKSSANMFQFELLRNVFVKNPTNDVELAYGSENVRPTLKNEIQVRLNTLCTFIQNSQWYRVFCNDIIVSLYEQEYGNESMQRTYQDMSAFECFLLFNMMSDRAKKFNSEVSRILPNIIYDPKRGYVVTRTIVNPLFIVFSGVTTISQQYEYIKVKSESYRPPAKGFSYSKNIGEVKNRHNVLDTKCL